jgi:hypothetical protein
LPKEIKLVPLPAVDGLAGSEEKAALAVYGWAEDQCVAVFTWYIQRRTLKARASKALRLASIVFAVTGSAIPFYVLASGSRLSTDWGYLALLLAAGCLVLDRGFGFSSSWARYVSTALAIEATISSARVMLLTTVSASAPGGKSEEICALAQTLMTAVNGHVLDETAGWVIDFQGAQDELRSRVSSVEN